MKHITLLLGRRPPTTSEDAHAHPPTAYNWRFCITRSSFYIVISLNGKSSLLLINPGGGEPWQRKPA